MRHAHPDQGPQRQFGSWGRHEADARALLVLDFGRRLALGRVTPDAGIGPQNALVLGKAFDLLYT